MAKKTPKPPINFQQTTNDFDVVMSWYFDEYKEEASDEITNEVLLLLDVAKMLGKKENYLEHIKERCSELRKRQQ